MAGLHCSVLCADELDVLGIPLERYQPISFLPHIPPQKVVLGIFLEFVRVRVRDRDRVRVRVRVRVCIRVAVRFRVRIRSVSVSVCPSVYVCVISVSVPGSNSLC